MKLCLIALMFCFLNNETSKSNIELLDQAEKKYLESIGEGKMYVEFRDNRMANKKMVEYINENKTLYLTESINGPDFGSPRQYTYCMKSVAKDGKFRGMITKNWATVGKRRTKVFNKDEDRDYDKCFYKWIKDFDTIAIKKSQIKLCDAHRDTFFVRIENGRVDVFYCEDVYCLPKEIAPAFQSTNGR
jgi:hypothetical protein